MKYMLLTLLIISSGRVALAHTCHTDTVMCPLDSEKVAFCVTMSMTTFGSYYDFQKKGAIGNHYEELINSCHKCHFSGYIDDFKIKFSLPQKDSIRLILEKFNDRQMDNATECEIAARICILMKNTNRKIADIFLTGSYFLRPDKENQEWRKQLQLASAAYFEKSIAGNEFKESEIASIDYLIAELNRRAGLFEKAILFFDLSINDKNKEDWVKKIALEQKALAEKKDDNNKI